MSSFTKTQELCFENDSLKAFKDVLQTVIPIILTNNRGLRINHQLPISSNWDNEGGWDWNGAPYILETPTETQVLEHSATFGGAKELKKKTQFKSKDEAAVFAHSLMKTKIPTRLFVCELADSKTTYDRKFPSTYYSNYEKLLEGTIQKIEDFPASDLFIKCRNKWEGSDISLGVAYRMDSHYSIRNSIVISLAHAYYGE